jgi:hypothetical protein
MVMPENKFSARAPRAVEEKIWNRPQTQPENLFRPRTFSAENLLYS